MCWSETPRGIFDSTRARMYGDALWKEVTIARAKDRALIQTLVNALVQTEALDNGCPLPTWQRGYDEMCDMRSNALDAAKEQGFTPTEE